MPKNSEKIRTFIALELPREIISEIESLQELIKKKNLFYGNFTYPENLHLTLKFLGEMPKEKLEEVKSKLKNIKFKKFEASLGELGLFINRYNSLLWIKLNGKFIWDLQKEIDEKLKDLFDKEERFMSHITLARMKKIPNKDELLGYIKNLKHREIKFEVKEFILKKSTLTPEGPIYEDIMTFNLNN